MVASIISAMVSAPRFADAIKTKIGSAVDTNDLEKQLEALQAQLRQTLGTKARLERQMDSLDVNDPYYDWKISDLQRRYDEQYSKIDEIEVQIDDVQSQIRTERGGVPGSIGKYAEANTIPAEVNPVKRFENGI